MSIKRFNARRDDNELAIVRALEGVGATVFRVDEPFDLCVTYRGRTIWIEVKRPRGKRGGVSHAQMNAKQQATYDAWQGGELYLVRDAVEALRALGIETEVEVE